MPFRPSRYYEEAEVLDPLDHNQVQYELWMKLMGRLYHHYGPDGIWLVSEMSGWIMREGSTVWEPFHISRGYLDPEPLPDVAYKLRIVLCI